MVDEAACERPLDFSAPVVYRLGLVCERIKSCGKWGTYIALEARSVRAASSALERH